MLFILSFPKLSKTDKKFIEDLYHSQLSHVWYLSLKILKNQEQAEDCCQSVFLKLVGKIPLLIGFQNEKRVTGYVNAVTKNTALQIIKKNNPKSDIDYETLENVLYSHNDEVERTLLEKEQWNDIQEIIICLSPIQRQAIYLRYFLELEYPEMADVMNITINTARARIHSAIVKIRAAVEKRGDYSE